MRFVIALTAFLCASVWPVKSADSSAVGSSSRYLDESYALHDKFDDSELAYYLSSLTRAAASIGADRTEEWCQKMFKASFGVSDPWDRIALEKSALVQLSRVKPLLAMQLFPKIQDPQPDTEGLFPEDVRADAAQYVFVNYAKAAGIGSNASVVADISRQARHIGETGEYPYRAMALVIKQITDKKAIDDIFREALNFYSHGSSKFQNRHKEFEFFLENTQSSVSSPGLFKSALQSFADAALRDVSLEHADFYAEFRSRKDKTKVLASFKDRNLTFLFRAYPMINASDPQLAAMLLQKHPEFSKATEDWIYDPWGFVQGNPTPEEAAKLHQRMHENVLVLQIQQLQDTNPLEARRQVDKLTDSSLRTIALSSVVPGMMRNDPATGQGIYLEQLTRLPEVTDSADNLRARVSLAQAAYHTRDFSNFQLLSLTALDAGTQLFHDDVRQRPDLRTGLHRGFDELNEVVRFGVAHGLSGMVNYTERMPTATLKAYLLISIAQSSSALEKATSQ